MSISCTPPEGIAIPRMPVGERSFPKHFWLGVAMAAMIWGMLGVGATISVSSPIGVAAPSLSISR